MIGSMKTAHNCIGEMPALEKSRKESAAGGTGTIMRLHSTGSLATSLINGRCATPTSPVGAGLHGFGKNAQV